MGRIDQGLEDIVNAFSDIKDAIADKGVTMPDLVTADEFAGYIDSISTGNNTAQFLETCTDWSYLFCDARNSIGVRQNYLQSGDFPSSSHVTNFEFFAGNCTTVTRIPQLDTSNAAKVEYMFYHCYNVADFQNSIDFTSVPTSNRLNYTFEGLGRNSNALGTLNIALPATVSSASYTFNYSGFTEINITTSSTILNANNMFAASSRLVTLSGLNFSGCTNIDNTFGGCTALANVSFASGGMLPDLNISFSACTALTHDSLMNIINALPVTANSRRLTLGSTNIAKLSSDEQTLITAKGWTLA